MHIKFFPIGSVLELEGIRSFCYNPETKFFIQASRTIPSIKSSSMISAPCRIAAAMSSSNMAEPIPRFQYSLRIEIESVARWDVFIPLLKLISQLPATLSSTKQVIFFSLNIIVILFANEGNCVRQIILQLQSVPLSALRLHPELNLCCRASYSPQTEVLRHHRN